MNENMSQEIEQLEHLQEKAAKSGLLSKYNNVEIVAYISVAVSALTAAWLSVGRMFADKLEKEGLLTSIRREKASEYKRFFGEDQKHSLAQSIQKTYEIEKKYHDGFKKIAKENFGTTNTIDKWQLLRPHQRIQTAATFFGILTIVGVALYTLRKEKTARDAIEEKRLRAQLEHKEAKDEVKRIEAKVEAIQEATEEIYKDKPVAIGEKSEALLKQRETANENNIAI